MPEASSYSWCLQSLLNQQRMASRRALEWIWMSKAQPVLRYEKYQTCFVLFCFFSILRVNKEKGMAPSFLFQLRDWMILAYQPVEVSHYIMCHYYWLSSLHTVVQRKYHVEPTVIQRQPQINAKMRAILIDWLIQVHLRFTLLQETLYLTISVIDRYLQVCEEVPGLYITLACCLGSTTPSCQTSPTHCCLQLTINAMWHSGIQEQMLLQWSIMGMANSTYTHKYYYI